MASASASSSSSFSTYLSAADAAALDRDLMDAETGAAFSLDQLMELAGLHRWSASMSPAGGASTAGP